MAKEQQKNGSANIRIQKATLNAEINKRKRALARLEELYLFSDAPLSQHDYLIKQKRLKDEIDNFQDKLSALQHNSIFATNLSDEQFIYKATSIIFQNALQADCINMETLAKEIGNAALKDFINSIISNIVVKNSRVLEITFMNGITHHFRYS